MILWQWLDHQSENCAALLKNASCSLVHAVPGSLTHDRRVVHRAVSRIDHHFSRFILCPTGGLQRLNSLFETGDVERNIRITGNCRINALKLESKSLPVSSGAFSVETPKFDSQQFTQLRI